MPASGQVSLSQANVELDYAATAQISMNDANVRSLGDKASGAIAFSDFYNRYYTFYGQELFTDVGVSTWTCPEEVTNIAAVCIGGGGGGGGGGDGGAPGAGGGLGWKNNIPVTPGTDYYVLVGGGGSRTGIDNPYNDGVGSHFIVADSPPVAISSVSMNPSGGVTTVTCSSPHGLSSGDKVTIESSWKAINGTYTMTPGTRVINSVTFSFVAGYDQPASVIQTTTTSGVAPSYRINYVGTTDFTQFGAASNTVGTTFVATANASDAIRNGTIGDGLVAYTYFTSNPAVTGVTTITGWVWKGEPLVKGGGGDSGSGTYGGDWSPNRSCMGGLFLGDGGGFGQTVRGTDASTGAGGGGASGYDSNGGTNAGGCGGTGSGSNLRGGGGGGVGLYGEGISAPNRSPSYNGGGLGGSRNIVEADFSGTTMTVTSVTSVGNLKVGSYIFEELDTAATRTVAGSGGAIPLGTYITALGTGTGGVGTYTISTSVTASGVTVGSFADDIGGWRGGTHDSTGTTAITGLTANEYASISTVGNSDWTAIGAPDSYLNSGFVATGAGTGTGVAFNGGFGNSYGGGGGGHDSSSAGPGSQGGVRLIYGDGRAFPATLTTDQPEGHYFGTA